MNSTKKIRKSVSLSITKMDECFATNDYFRFEKQNEKSTTVGKPSFDWLQEKRFSGLIAKQQSCSLLRKKTISHNELNDPNNYLFDESIYAAAA
ncbi:hypothetical protein CDAR_446841 [Caerostris darwini]|uniref:Uncharacterized protein n=1 Tax=Caerostris darwini TaxID=1538125 RepID=A0AAV4MNL1_9ARAC|nr:hypothetical protein CDAR_446841 [Caerostris darwini]